MNRFNFFLGSSVGNQMAVSRSSWRSTWWPKHWTSSSPQRVEETNNQDAEELIIQDLCPAPVFGHCTLLHHTSRCSLLWSYGWHLCVKKADPGKVWEVVSFCYSPFFIYFKRDGIKWFLSLLSEIITTYNSYPLENWKFHKRQKTTCAHDDICQQNSDVIMICTHSGTLQSTCFKGRAKASDAEGWLLNLLFTWQICEGLSQPLSSQKHT